VGFTVFASVVIGAMVVGLVALNAFLAQTSFRIDDLDAKLGDLTDRNAVLTRQVADRSAPGRIADWAARHGMRLPDDIHILLVPGRSLRSDPAGARNLSDPAEATP
jgi:cell division protein FtsL